MNEDTINAYWQHRQALQRLKPYTGVGYRVVTLLPSGKVEILEIPVQISATSKGEK